MQKSNHRADEEDMEADLKQASSREEEFWREQELQIFDNNCSTKRRLWREIAHQDAATRKQKELDEQDYQECRRVELRKYKIERAELKKNRKITIRHALKIINPPTNRWRECCREIIYELSELQIDRSSKIRWTKVDHLSAVNVVKALKKACNEAKKLPSMEAAQLVYTIEDLRTCAEKFADEPYGELRSAADKRQAVRSAFRLLSRFANRPSSTTRSSPFHKLAAALVGEEAGLDHHCRALLRRANRV